MFLSVLMQRYCFQELVLSHEEGSSPVDDALLEGHLGVTRELLLFQPAQMKYAIGSQKDGSNLIKVNTSCRFRQVLTKEKEFAYITGFSYNVYKTILAAEARISTTITPRSYISAMLLALKSLLFLCSDIFEP